MIPRPKIEIQGWRGEKIFCKGAYKAKAFYVAKKLR